MRINLTKKDIINAIYMQIGFSKKIKIEKFGTFSLIKKKQRIGRNPKTKENKIISERYVVLFKASKEFKSYINKNE